MQTPEAGIGDDVKEPLDAGEGFEDIGPPRLPLKPDLMLCQTVLDLVRALLVTLNNKSFEAEL